MTAWFLVSDQIDLSELGYGSFLHLPVSLCLAILLALLATVIAWYTRLGRRFYMVGSGPSAAWLVGIDVRRTVAAAYILCGMSAGLAAIFFLARAGAGLPTIGSGLEFSARSPRR